MTDITFGSVKPTSGYEHLIQHGIVGEAVTVGMFVYLSGGKVYKAVSDTEAHAAAVGMVLETQATVGGAVSIMPSGGSVDCTGLTEGVGVIVSDTAGGAKPVAALGSSEFWTYLGEGTNARMLINIHATPDQLA
jgi:hypothetical protein